MTKQSTLSFCTVFPGYRDLHFYKDPGQIPYRFALRGFEASVVCYGNPGDNPVTERHLEVVTVPDRYFTRKFNAGIAWYLVRHARTIDILNLFHYSWSSLLFAYIYKAFNRKGFAYLKLDDCLCVNRDSTTLPVYSGHRLRLTGAGAKGQIRRYIAQRCFEAKIDLWSIEDERSRSMLEADNPFLKGRVITVYNGHTGDLPGAPAYGGTGQKEEIIMTAGRLGSFQKATEVLLDAFRIVAPDSCYNLHLAGPAEPEFMASADQFFRENPELKERIIFHGPLQRNELYELYNRSRIFCLPSRYEGMAVVLPEAMYYGNAIITTNDGSLKPLIEKHRFGLLVDRDDSRGLADAILKLAASREMTDRMAEKAREISSGLLSWDKITDLLIEEINRRKTEVRQ